LETLKTQLHVHKRYICTLHRRQTVRCRSLNSCVPVLDLSYREN